MIQRFENHSHTHKSNLVNLDSTNFEDKLIDKALEINLSGISITDHGCLSSHVDALLYLKKLREDAKKDLEEFPNDPDVMKEYEKLKNFKLGLGSEIYLVDREVIEKARQMNESIKFYHLVLVAKNYDGYRALAELSSKSWEDAFTFKGLMRCPTYKDYFTQWAKANKGNIVCSSACLGSEFANLILNFANEQTLDNKQKIIDFVEYMKSLFGEDFYIELQPSFFEEQKIYNKIAFEVAYAMGVRVIITTDAHYLSKDKQELHSIFLKSQNSERETEQFYSSTYLMDNTELKSYFDYMSDEQFNWCLNNSNLIKNSIEEYDLKREIEVPKTTICFEEKWTSILDKYTENYPYIEKFVNSEHLIDRTLIQQIEKGIIKKNIYITTEVLVRINRELESLWEISENLHQRLASYYLLTKEIVSIMWEVSLVGVSRGSAGAFYISYLLEICQINPIESEFNLPDWRHIDKSKVELADIDLDTEKGQRANILQKVKEKFGFDRVLNIATFKTQAASNSILAICRGLGIPTEDAAYLSSLVPEGMTVNKALKMYKEDKECELLIKELMNYEGLVEYVCEIEGLCCGRSVHASGVYIFNEEYWKCNAMMRAPNGQPITQFDMSCSDYQGGLKLDFLTIEALDRIRKSLELMLKDNLIEWQGSLKATYDKYIHPDVLILDNEKMWLTIRYLLDAFQYDSPQGKTAIAKLGIRTFKEAMDGNALMRLVCEGQQPIDRYVLHKQNINLWYREMISNGLNEDEIEVMKSHLLDSYGVACTQESVMRLAMDKKIANFDLKLANKLRKAIAKAKAKHMIGEVKQLFIDNGIAAGNRLNILNYVWTYCIEPMLGYAFSEPHIAGYTLILAQELYIAFYMSMLHWKVACLAVNAGEINEDITSNTDYGAIAKAIGDMEKGFVVPPDINKAEVGFRPDAENNKCLYGLGAINGVSIDLAKEIIKLRPFNSFEDFIEKCIKTKMVQPSKAYNLIKGGCFDSVSNGDRINTMVKFINHLVPNKEKLTLSNVNKFCEMGLLPREFEEHYLMIQFNKLVFKKENCVEMFNKTQGKFRVPANLMDYVKSRNLESVFIDAIDYDDEGQLCLLSKEFTKKYKEVINPLMEWLKTTDAIDRYNYGCKNEVWIKNCFGTIAKWEMDSISYYTDKHELDEIRISQFYDIDNFKELPTEPKTYFHVNERTGRQFKRLRLNIIAGTVVDKNKSKNLITLNTQYGVVQVKLYKEAFARFDRRTSEEPSWFSRGTKLIVVGYRRGETFIPRIYPESRYTSNIMKVEINKNGNLELISERKSESQSDIICYL